MKITGLRELERTIEVSIAAAKHRLDRAIGQEIEYLGAKIKSRLGSLGSYVEIDIQGKGIVLRYVVIEKKSTTARDYHNPASRRFNITGQRQPFQDVLAEEGYENISPAQGQTIQVVQGEAPGVRITATMGPDAVRRLQRFMDGGS
jgi:hypothetical protein